MNCPEYAPDHSPIGPTQLKDDINVRHAVRSAGICKWYKFHNRPCFPFISTWYCHNGEEEPNSPKKEKTISMRLGRDYSMDKRSGRVSISNKDILTQIEKIQRGTPKWKDGERARIGGPAPEPGDKRIWYKSEEDYLRGIAANEPVQRSSGGGGGPRGPRQSYEFNCDDCGVLWSLKVNRTGPKYCAPCITIRRKNGTGPGQQKKN